MRISDWSSDVFSSDLLQCRLCSSQCVYRVRSLWRTTGRPCKLFLRYILVFTYITTARPFFHRFLFSFRYFHTFAYSNPVAAFGSFGLRFFVFSHTVSLKRMVIPAIQFFVQVRVYFIFTRSEEHTSYIQSLMRISYAV